MKKVTEDLIVDMRDMLRDHVLQVALDQGRWKAFYLRDPRCNMGRMQSTCLMFTPEGIVIFGDLCPGNDHRNSGVISCYGYGLDWFAGGLSSGYLCEKFLAKGFQKEEAAVDLRETAAKIRSGNPDAAEYVRGLRKITGERAELAEELRDALADRRAGLSGTEVDLADIRRRAGDTKTLALQVREELARRYESLADAVECGDMGYERFGGEYRDLTGDDCWYEACPGWTYEPRAAALLVAVQEKFAELYAKLAKPEPVGDMK